MRKAGFELEADRYAVGHLKLEQQREAALERGDLEWAEQLNREPTRHRGPVIDAMERKGIETERGNIERETLDVQARAQPEPRHENADRVEQWWQRIEQAIDKGGGFEEARNRGWLNQPYGPELEQLREFRKEVVGMRQELNIELADRELAPEYRAALREMAGELRDFHYETSKQIVTLALEQSAYEPQVIEMGRSRLDEFAHSIEGMGREAGDLAAGVADLAGKAVEGLVDFFMTPSLPTPELMAARREAAEARTEQAEIKLKGWKEADAYRAQADQQDKLKREQEEQEYRRKQERELHPNERERER